MFTEMPPDTSAYMIGGYVVFFSVITIYLVSLIVRWVNLKRDLRTLEELKEE